MVEFCWASWANRSSLCCSSVLRWSTRRSNFSRRRSVKLSTMARAAVRQRPVRAVSQASHRGCKVRNPGPAVAVTAKVLPKARTGRMAEKPACERPSLRPVASGSGVELRRRNESLRSEESSVGTFWNSDPTRRIATAKPRKCCACPVAKTGRQINNSFSLPVSCTNVSGSVLMGKPLRAASSKAARHSGSEPRS